MQEMAALVAGAGKSWLEGRTGEERNSGRKCDDGVAATTMEYFTSLIAYLQEILLGLDFSWTVAHVFESLRWPLGYK